MSRHLLTLIAPGRPRELGGLESAFIYVLAAVTCSVFIAVAYGYYINGMLLMYAFLGVVLAVSFVTYVRMQKVSLADWRVAASELGDTARVVRSQFASNFRPPR